MAIQHITLRQLEVFREVVREGSVSAAARRLHLTQPTVSIQLRKLSEQLGAVLLEPRGGRLQVTDAGEALFLAAGDMLARLQELEASLQHVREGVRGRLSLGVVTTASYVLPRLLGPFSRDYPDIELVLNAGNRGQILERFRRQADDLYLFSHPPERADVESTPFVRNPLVVIAPPQHPAAGRRKSFPFRDLLDERFLLREPGSGTGMTFGSWLEHSGLQLENVMQVASNEGIYLSVAGGMGLAVISEHVVRSRSEAVAILKVREFPLSGHWYLVRNKQRRVSPVARAFQGYLRDHLTELEPEYAVRDLPAFS